MLKKLLSICLLMPTLVMASGDLCDPKTSTIGDCVMEINKRIKKLEKENQALKMRLFLTDGLVAYYPFNGNANDVSGNGNHGTEHGNINYVQGKYGQAANFDGVNAYIQITPKSDVSKIGNFTIVTWVFLEGWKKQNPDRQYIFDGHTHSSTTTSDFYRPGFGLIYDRRASYEEIHNFIFYDSDRFSEQNTQVSIGRNWHQLLFMRKGKDDFTYFDGELLPATHSRKKAIDEALNMAHNWFIGTFSGNNPHYNQGKLNYSFFGIIDEFRIYNRALTDVEIKSLYKQR
ncbi:LamG-like jellyroll fold domain-containing protein [Candidatus Parabeggiatoa sp. HSG14]|uniref:LamG-like jellyroll fold domain-containing protein n=1 Tax=Candidatus Parabeggiatoa sp. HSG14 TaxID=3055593 RepID=UPI0025A696FD|nr:hypothetical protein [Thiotrichales bacterium HSG14]